MKTISIPTNDRPLLLQRTLASIRACPEHGEWTLVFSCEPNPVIASIVRNITWARVAAPRNLMPVRAGINLNTFLAASMAHALGSEFNLYLEDDIILSRDALTLANQFYASGVGGILCLRRWEKTQDIDKPYGVSPAHHGLLGDGFAYARALWEKTIRPWWFWYESGQPFGWDWSVSYGLDKQGVKQWRPLLHRSQNIGFDGTNTVQGTDPNRFSECYKGPAVQQFVFT